MQKTRTRRSALNLGDSARWSAYAAAGVAGAIGVTQTAEAAITYVDNADTTLDAVSAQSTQSFIAPLTGGASLYFGNIGLVASASATTVLAGWANFSVIGGSSNSFVGTAPFYAYASNLSFGANLSAQNFLPGFGTMAFSSFAGSSQFGAAGIGYLGFQFNVGNGIQYGWARVSMDSGRPDNTFTVLDYAYGDAGDAVTVGQVPEPGSLGLLALGAVGLMGWRKRRGEAA